MSFTAWRRANMLVFEEFLLELAAHLGRSKAEVRRTGILATEFPYQWVRVYYDTSREDADSVFDLSFAFPLFAPKKGIAVFAQTAGYFAFNHLCAIAVRPRMHWKREKLVWSAKGGLRT